MYLRARACVVHVLGCCESETEREKKREKERERERYVYSCVAMCDLVVWNVHVCMCILHKRVLESIRRAMYWYAV